MKILDVKGMKCPMPLIETKKALKTIEKNESFKVITDNPTSVKNIMHFLNDNNIFASQTNDGEIHEIIINQTDHDLDLVDEEVYCTPEFPETGNYIMVFTTDSLGQGSHELGYALIGSMLATIKSMDHLPTKIIFMNSGINLVLNNSNFLNNLRDLEKRNVELITCGTCLDYYDKMKELGISRISNMLEILESMQKAQKVITI